MQVCEQTLKALGMEVCGDLIGNRGLIGALFSPIATDSFLSAGLGLGRTVHGEPAKEGEISRKGISCERTFAAISSTADLEAKVWALPYLYIALLPFPLTCNPKGFAAISSTPDLEVDL